MDPIVDPTQLSRAEPTLDALLAALKELRDTGAYFHDETPLGPALRREAEAVVALVDGALAASPAARRFLYGVLVAREARLSAARGGRRRRQ